MPGLLNHASALGEHRGLAADLATARSTERSELTFLVSVRVPNRVEPVGLSDTLASQRSWPSSIRAAEMPSTRTSSRSSVTYALAIAGASGGAPRSAW